MCSRGKKFYLYDEIILIVFCFCFFFFKERILLNPTYGIKNDVKDFSETSEHTDGEMRTISPESILQTNLYREDVFLSQASEPISQHNMSGHSDISVFLSSPEKHSIQNTPVKSPYWPGRNKRKQYTPKRSPFNNITNLRLQPSVSEAEEDEEEVEEDEEECSLQPAAKKFKSETCGKFLRRSPGVYDYSAFIICGVLKNSISFPFSSCFVWLIFFFQRYLLILISFWDVFFIFNVCLQ